MHKSENTEDNAACHAMSNAGAGLFGD